MSPATESIILGPVRKNKESSVINHIIVPGICLAPRRLT